MRKLILGLLSVLASINAFASAPPNAPEFAYIQPKNILVNPGFEQGKARWTASGGTFTLNSTASHVGSGNSSASWDSNSASQTLTSTAVTIPAGLYGANGAVSCRFQCASGSCTHTISAYDGSSTLASATIISSTSAYPRTTLNFPIPTSGSISLRVTSVASDEPTLYVDDCYLGSSDGFNTGTTLPITDFQSYTPTFTGFGTASSINAKWRQVGTAIHIIGSFTCGTSTATEARVSLPNSWTANMAANQKVGDVSWSNSGVTNQGHVFAANGNSYTTFTRSLAGTSGNTNSNGNGLCGSGDSIYYYAIVPITQLSGATTYSAENLGSNWSGYHDDTCSWARSNTSYGDPAADASCGFTERTNRNFGTVTSYLSGSDKLPGIVFTPTRSGRYMVCYTSHIRTGGLPGVSMSLELSDLTPTVIFEAQTQADITSNTNSIGGCGIYNASSTASTTLRLRFKSSANDATIVSFASVPAIEWSIFSIDQSLPFPALVGSVSSNTTSAERIESAAVTCSAASSITKQSGTWLSAIGNRSGNSCTLTIPSGIFSDLRACVVTVSSSTVTAMGAGIVSNTSALVYGPSADYDAFIMCMGRR